MKQQRCIVIGAGIGGMTAAALLANKGYDVMVLEQSTTYGGKVGRLQVGDAIFDTGPSVCTDPEIIDAIYTRCGKNPRDYWNYEPLAEATRYFWPEDGTEYVMPVGQTRIERSIVHAFSEKPKKVHAYFKKTTAAYKAAAPMYLDTPVRVRTLLRPRSLVAAMRILPLLVRSLQRRNAAYFLNTKTVQLFNRFATYSGSNPYRTPAISGFASMPEITDGVYAPHGGMRAIADGLYALTTDLGVRYQWNEKVTAIKRTNNTAHVVRAGKHEYPCDYIVYAGDYARLYSLLGNVKAQQVSRRPERSTSAVVFYWEVKGTFKRFGLHNIIFSSDYQHEYEQLSRGDVPDDPTLYINVTCKVEPSHAHKGTENWFVMVNVPAGTKEVAVLALKEIVRAKLETVFGGYITILNEDYLSPARLDAQTGAWHGAIYGQATNSVAALLRRPKNRIRTPSNIITVGGTVHPGGGIPLVVRSAIIATESL